MAALCLILVLCLATAQASLGQPPPSTGVGGLVITPETLKPGIGDTTWVSFLGAAGDLITAQAYPFVRLRTNFILAVSGYEALAAYSPGSAGLFFGKRYKRPAAEHTVANQRVAVYTTIFRTMITLFGPDYLGGYPAIMKAAGLNPDDNSTNPATPVGLGNRLGVVLARHFLNDGFNQLGNLPNVKYNRVPFSDYTGYEPVNTAYHLKDPRRWQPVTHLVAVGVSYIQQYVGAQASVLKPLTMPKIDSCFMPRPNKTLDFPSAGYKAQALKLLAQSAALNDSTKALADFFEGGENWFFPLIFLSNKYKWTLEQQVKYQFALQLANYDGLLSVLYWKRYYDTIRPISAIRYSGVFKKVRAWGGPGKGTVRMDAQEWRPWNRETSPEPEYPSGGAMLHSITAETGRRYVGTDNFGWNPVIPAGASKVEPGMTPKRAVVIRFPTFTSYAMQGQLGRQLGGVHFEDGAKAGTELGVCISNFAYKKAQALFKGA